MINKNAKETSLCTLITRDNWLKFVPHDTSFSFYRSISLALIQHGLLTKNEILFFVAQAFVETAHFKTFIENFNYKPERAWVVFQKHFKDFEECKKYCQIPRMLASRVYANRFGNGDETTGDGWNYRGRGFFQLTFKDNYKDFGKTIGVDLVNYPFMLDVLVIGLESAVWFWKTRKLSDFAINNDFETVTKRITGSVKDLERRSKVLKQLNDLCSY